MLATFLNTIQIPEVREKKLSTKLFCRFICSYENQIKYKFAMQENNLDTCELQR